VTDGPVRAVQLSDGDRAVKVGELLLILDQIRELYASAGANGPGKDLKTLIDILGPQANNSVEAFVTDTKRRLREGSPKATSRKKAPAVAAPLNDSAIRSYVAQLSRAGTDRAAFNGVFERLKADKLLRLPELTEIAHQYSGGVAKLKSIASAHEDISKAFIRQARFANKLL